MIYYVDGWMAGKNPCRSGGFTVFNEHNELVKVGRVSHDPFTNNHAELLAIAYAAFIAAPGDTIITDSQAAYYWVKSGIPKKRMDLYKIAQKAHRWVKRKKLTVEWQPREVNLAGQYNEKHLDFERA